MTRAEQRKFLKANAGIIVQDMLLQFKDVPAEWDGHELRCWLQERFDSNASMSCIRRDPRSRRARSYRNTMLCNPNL